MSELEVTINYTKVVEKFLRKYRNFITEEELDKAVTKAVYKINGFDLNIDVKELKGRYKGKYRVRKGKIRIIFTIDENGNIYIVAVEEIDFRGDIYKKH